MPSKDELVAMVQIPQGLSAARPYSNWFNANGFSNVQADFYWSSSTFDTNRALDVYFNGGDVIASNKSYFFYVWPVRLARTSGAVMGHLVI